MRRSLLAPLAAALVLVPLLSFAPVAAASEPTSIQAVYAVPSDVSPISGRDTAIAENVVEVQDWFAGQTADARYPVFNLDGGDVAVATVVLPNTRAEVAAMSSNAVTSMLHAQIDAQVPAASNSERLVILEGADNSGACGYSGSMIVIPVDNCDIQPSSPATFPYGITYLIAHELTHMLGAVPSCAPNALPGGHVSGDNRDILFQGGARDWNNLMLDPGHDDYYLHGNSGCTDIADSPLLGTNQTNPSGHTCSGQPATIVGTEGADTITGTPGADVIVTLGGDDWVDGLDGNDLICTGEGVDFVYGGEGNDYIDAGGGHDRIWGELGRDTIHGGAGRDSVVGGSGVDHLYGGIGSDRIKGGSAGDFIYGENGRDRLLGGNGNDQIRGGGGNDRLFGGNNVDSLNGGGARDECTATGGTTTRCEVVL
ncbi:MAG: calcium-binding protein [Acidimicrobiales bacterium]